MGPRSDERGEAGLSNSMPEPELNAVFRAVGRCSANQSRTFGLMEFHNVWIVKELERQRGHRDDVGARWRYTMKTFGIGSYGFPMLSIPESSGVVAGPRSTIST